jgi:hypothetical protein
LRAAAKNEFGVVQPDVWALPVELFQMHEQVVEALFPEEDLQVYEQLHPIGHFGAVFLFREPFSLPGLRLAGGVGSFTAELMCQ